MMYNIVSKMETSRDKYRKLIIAGGIKAADVEQIDKLTWDSME